MQEETRNAARALVQAVKMMRRGETETAGRRLARAAAEIMAQPPLPSRNSCGVIPVCLRKKRAKCDGSAKPRS